MSRFDDAWQERVLALGDEVFRSAGPGVFLGSQVNGDREIGLLWEAEPRAFAARFPDSEIEESYGPGGWRIAHCIDFWVYVDTVTGEARTSFEGWSGPDLAVRLTGDARSDAATVASLLRDHLRLPPDGSARS